MALPSFTFLVAITLLTITPGVDTLMVIRNSARGGWRDGAVTSLGICSGLFVHATLSALGISVILMQSAWAFGLLKLAGAGYLVWLGLVSLRGAIGGTRLFTTPRSSAGRFDPYRSFREGVLSNVLNPKAVLFYMAFLPQFIDPAGSPLQQSLLLAGIHFVIAMLWQCLLAGAVQRARASLLHPRVQRLFAGMTGSLMVAIGAKLALER